MLEKIIVDPLTDSNCYLLVSGDRVLIVDPNNFQKIHSYLTEKNLTPELVILTHEHCDHIAALNDLRKQYPVKVLCSDACSRGIQSTTLNMTRIMETYLYFKSNGKMRVSYPPFTCQPADITFEKVYTTTWRRHTILCQSAPGHTPGSSCIIGEARFTEFTHTNKNISRSQSTLYIDKGGEGYLWTIILG